MISNELVFVFIIIFLWLSILSLIFYIIYRHYNRLAALSNKGDLKKVLDVILDNMKVSKREILEINKRIEKLNEDLALRIKRVPVARYNPFGEVGGNQSFSLAILNSHGDGVVITGLHAKGATRVYVKDVKQGGSTYELSSEEKKVINQALS